MSPDLLFVGLAKLLFGLLVGVVGITLASRLLDRWLGERGSGPAIREGNLALAIVRGAGFVGLAILGRNSVLSSFAALDYLQLSGAGEWGLGGRMVLYGTLHTAVALVAGACVLGVGVLVFDRLTAGIEERRLVRSGEVAPAVVLGAILIALALVTAPGLQATLDGLLPLPELPAGVLPSPN